MRESIPNMDARMDIALRLHQDGVRHVLKCDLGDAVTQRLLREEADMLHELRHPHVVNLYRVLGLRWPSEDSVALDMEHCVLGDVLHARLSTMELRACFEQMLSALLYLHSEGAGTISLNTATATIDMVRF